MVRTLFSKCSQHRSNRQIEGTFVLVVPWNHNHTYVGTIVFHISRHESDAIVDVGWIHIYLHCWYNDLSLASFTRSNNGVILSVM
jgi:hypothetical protein